MSALLKIEETAIASSWNVSMSDKWNISMHDKWNITMGVKWNITMGVKWNITMIHIVMLRSMYCGIPYYCCMRRSTL